MWPREDHTGFDGYEVTAPRRWITYGVLGLVVLLIVGAGILLHWQQGSRALAHVFEPGTLDFSLSSRLKERPAYKEPPTRDDVKVDTSAAELAKLRAELEALKQARTTPRVQTPASQQPSAPTRIKRPEPFFVTNQRTLKEKVEDMFSRLAAWSVIPCSVESVIHSEIEGVAILRVRRAVTDMATMSRPLIPQNLRIGAKTSTAALLLGNERIPMPAVSLSLSDGREVPLEGAYVTDQAGTMGLTGSVDNHIWRLVWSTVLMGGLRGGQQVLQQELATTDGGAIAAGIASQADRVAQQRLGRAQDTRPTITVEAGQGCNVLLTKPVDLPDLTMVSREWRDR